MTINWMTIRKFSEETGYSEHAIRSKIRDGVWLESQVWTKAAILEAIYRGTFDYATTFPNSKQAR